MGKEKVGIGVFINNGCGTRLNSDDVGQIADSVFFSNLIDKKDIHFQKELGKGGSARIKEEVKKRGYTKVVIAGYSPTFHERNIEEIAESAGLAYGAVRAVPLLTNLEQTDRDGFIRRSAGDIIKALRILHAMPEFEEKKLELTNRVLVVGGGVSGIQAAATCANFGYEVVVIDQADAIDGDLRLWSNFSFDGEGLSADALHGMKGVTVKTDTSLIGLTGAVGNFNALLEREEQSGVTREEVKVGAIILSAGLRPDVEFPEKLDAILTSPSVEPMNRLADKVNELPVSREVRSVGLVLDLHLDETKASTEMALAIANTIQERDRVQVHIFVKDVRVAAKGLQQYYDTVRDSGVNIVKYTDIDLRPDENGVVIEVRDAVLEEKVGFVCDCVGISGYGLPRATDKALLDITGVLPDRTGKLQENNIHLFPVETNRPGIFLAGANRGTLYIPSIIEEARAAAMAAHELLFQKTMTVTRNEVQVDPDKCILCLTCVRCCPYKAMHIDRENSVAVSYPEECQKCGICAGECPAKAITLPEYSDELLTIQL